MGLPGGRYDPDDPDLLHTAIRETLEEVGVSLTPAQLLGGLDDVAPRTPTPVRVRVRPFVFALTDRPALALSDEVARAIWVDVEELLRPGTYRPYSLHLRGEDRTFPAYHIGEHVVWGLTERILTPLLEAIENR
jgi:8-oxo-dGTP pyrophosphatase MutT (NUDIX family)